MSDILIRNVSDELKIKLDNLQVKSPFETQNSFLLNVIEEYATESFKNNRSNLFIESEKDLIKALVDNTEALSKLFGAFFDEGEVNTFEK